MPRCIRWAPAAAFAVALAMPMSTPVLARPRPAKRSPSASACRRYDQSPASRTLYPASVYRTTGTVSGPRAVLGGHPTRITGAGSSVTLDFGKEVAGIVKVHFAAASDASQSLGLAFSESPSYVGEQSDASQGGGGADGVLTAAVTAPGSYTMPADKLRGGFRYLTLFLQSSGWVEIDGVSLEFTAAPGKVHPNGYPNYFCSSDRLLDRIWYAGAYTIQLDTIDPTQGRVWPPPASGWENNGDVGVGHSVLVDGAKRDRTVWPGDYGISVPTVFASIGDTTSVRNGLETLYQRQDALGATPYAGPEVNFPGEASDTYLLWTLVETANYYLYTGDKAWLDGIWSQYARAVQYCLMKVDPRGLMLVSGQSDWAPSSTGETVEANSLLYKVLTTGAQLAAVEGASATASGWAARAVQLRAAINNLLWDPAKGAYMDNGHTSSATESPLYPQDGNSLAVWFGVAAGAQAQRVLGYLKGNWNRYGATAPEWNGDISPFPGSMEVYARFTAGDNEDAVALIRREWGYMLAAKVGNGSTFWEGYHKDGSLGYNASYPGAPAGNYTSLAHGWATGPTGALTFYLLGITPATAAGRTYSVIPHPADIAWVSGRLAMPAAAVQARWRQSRSAFTLAVSDAGAGTEGNVAIPRMGADRVIYVNGCEAWNGRRFLGASGIASADEDATYVYFRDVGPGSRTFSWSVASHRKKGRSHRRRRRRAGG